MKIYLVRHGEKETVGDDPTLTEHGRRQIILLARRLKHEKIKASRIYSTNHARSVATAEILSRALFLPVFRDDRLRELERGLFHDADLEVDTEEVLSIRNFVDELISRKQDVLLAMHGGINRAVISYLTGLNLKDMRNFSMDFANLSLIEHVDVRGTMMWRVKLLNDTTHLLVP
ncbi:MAG: histidine phosphatase family protein [Candidatus Pacearchaeota archaeon]